MYDPTTDSDIKNGMDELTYSKEVIRFLRMQLDDFAIDCFRMVVKSGEDGLLKTKCGAYYQQRKLFDYAFRVLEAQGFIEKKKVATMRPYCLTIRGKQLVQYLAEEKQMKNRNDSI
ncbi:MULTISPECIES: hypothetical protein [Pseudobacillus]|uniref:hypothetical protein n=1 Tax=Pseudobacillus TaxID=108525 RepID=UPI003879A84D